MLRERVCCLGTKCLLPGSYRIRIRGDGLALKTSSILSVNRSDGDKRPCDALGKGLSSWRHGQRTRFPSPRF